MASNPTGRVPNKPSFYDKHPLGPCVKGTGTWRDDLGRKGLRVNRAQLKQIKDFLLGLVRTKIEKGEWESNESFQGIDGAQKRKPLIDAAKEKFSKRFRWDLVPEGWADLALAKLLVIIKSSLTSNKRERRKAPFLQTIKSLKAPAPQKHSEETTSQASLLALPLPPLPPPVPSPPSKLSNQPHLSSKDSSPQPKNNFGQQKHQAEITKKSKKQNGTDLQIRKDQQSMPKDRGLCERIPIQEASISDKGLPSHSQAAPVQPEPYIQIPSPTPQSQSPTIAQEGIYQQMTIVVKNKIIKEEHVDEQPWEDIAVELLTEEGKVKAFNRLLLLPSDFSLTRLLDKLADSSQSPFRFEQDFHELVHIEDFKQRVVQYEATWRTILQQAANKGKKKLVFEARNIQKKT